MVKSELDRINYKYKEIFLADIKVQLLGILRKLKKKYKKVITADKKNLDLLNQKKVFNFKKKKPDLVIAAAAKVEVFT